MLCMWEPRGSPSSITGTAWFPRAPPGTTPSTEPEVAAEHCWMWHKTKLIASSFKQMPVCLKFTGHNDNLSIGFPNYTFNLQAFKNLEKGAARVVVQQEGTCHV